MAAMNRLRLPSMTGLVWWARRSAWYVGWIPMLLSMLLLLVWVELLQQHTLKAEQVALLEQKIKDLKAQAAKDLQTAQHIEVKPLAMEKTSMVESSPKTMSALWEQLPTTAELSPRMLEIAALAQKYQIPLNVGDYQWQVHQPAGVTHQAEATQQIEQFDMRFAVETDYATCRRFIIEVLRRYPTMALTGLELRKNETAQPMVEATLTFSMFIRGGREHAS
jgi:hypothetical protein